MSASSGVASYLFFINKLKELEKQESDYFSTQDPNYEYKTMKIIVFNQQDRDKVFAEEKVNGWEKIKDFDTLRFGFRRNLSLKSSSSVNGIDIYRKKFTDYTTIIAFFAIIFTVLITILILTSN